MILNDGNARVFIGGVEMYMAVCLRCLCGGMMENCMWNGCNDEE